MEHLVKECKEKRIIYYYIDHTSKSTIRTGIQILTIYLARQLIKKAKQHNIKIVFVKWDNDNNEITPSTTSEINHFFNYNEKEDLIKVNTYNEFEVINVL